VRTILRAALVALAAAACSDISGGGGRTQVLLTDSPFPYDSIEAVNVYVARIEVSTSTDTSGGDPQSWITVATPERAFNMLDLQNGSSALLGESDLAAAQYAAVRMVINTSRSSIVRNDGSQVPVEWPVAGELTLYAFVEQPLAITASAGGHIVIDFDVGRSFVMNIEGRFTFLPYIRAVNDELTGTIQGAVSYAPGVTGMSLHNIAIEVYWDCDMCASLVATGRTDAQGHYAIPLLRAYGPTNSYTVQAYPPGYPWMRASVAGIMVTAGSTSTANLVIGPDSTGGGGGGGGCCDSLPPPPDTTTPPGGGTGPVDHIRMTPAAQTVNVGDSISVLAVKEDSLNRALTDNAFLWTISDTTVVRRTWQGGGWILLRALKSGGATVTARDTLNAAIAGTATVTVR